MAIGYGVLEDYEAENNPFTDWDRCVDFLLMYIKYLFHSCKIELQMGGTVLEDIHCEQEFPRKLLNLEKVEELFQMVCGQTKDDYYMCWIDGLRKVVAYGKLDHSMDFYDVWNTDFNAVYFI